MFLRPHSISDMAWDRYVTPFSYGLWSVATITGCALGVCLAIINFSNKRNESLSLIATVFYVPSCFCQQGQKAILTYEFFNFCFVLPVLIFFLLFLLFSAFLPFSCHSYSSFFTCSCTALNNCTNITPRNIPIFQHF